MCDGADANAQRPNAANHFGQGGRKGSAADHGGGVEQKLVKVDT